MTKSLRINHLHIKSGHIADFNLSAEMKAFDALACAIDKAGFLRDVSI